VRAGGPRFVSLRTKLVAATMLILTGLLAGVIAVVEHRQHAAIVEEMHRRGTLLATSLAAVSTGPLLLYDYTALEQNVARSHQEADVAYALIVDRAGQVLADSRTPARVGLVLDDPVSARALEQAPIIQTTAGGGDRALYDIAVPIVVERERWATVRIGLSRRRMDAQIATTRRELAGLALATLAAAALAMAMVARRITRPVRQLSAGVAAIARGELDHRLAAAPADEIGALALAFNDMAAQLERQRTELEAAHQALRQRFTELSDLKSYTDHILGSLGSGIVTLDLDGRVVTLNATAAALTAQRIPAAVGRPATEVFRDAPELRDLLLETLRTRVGVPPVSLALPCGDAGPVPVEASTTPLRGAEGQALGVVAVLRDLTAVRELEAQLRRSDRLVALGTLAAGLAHEIKNPLTSVMTFSRHLARRFDDERFRQRFQSVVPRELERINAIVEGLLRLARPTRLTLAPVHLPALVEQALELYAPRLEARQIRVRRECAVGLPPVPGDAEHLYQAVLNLVANAIDAMEAGGILTARVGWPVPDPARPGLPPDRLLVEIGDTGPGIPAGEAPSLFDPFFTTKPGGTGLGLAITHKIVEDHGGTVTFRSTPGEGTVFTVALPVRSLRPAAESLAGERRLGVQAP